MRIYLHVIWKISISKVQWDVILSMKTILGWHEVTVPRITTSWFPPPSNICMADCDHFPPPLPHIAIFIPASQYLLHFILFTMETMIFLQAFTLFDYCLKCSKLGFHATKYCFPILHYCINHVVSPLAILAGYHKHDISKGISLFLSFWCFAGVTFEDINRPI